MEMDDRVGGRECGDDEKGGGEGKKELLERGEVQRCREEESVGKENREMGIRKDGEGWILRG